MHKTNQTKKEREAADNIWDLGHHTFVYDGVLFGQKAPTDE
jgi:hypothetical protein